MYRITTHDVTQASQVHQQFRAGTLALDAYEQVIITVVRRAFEQGAPVDRKTFDAFTNLIERI